MKMSNIQLRYVLSNARRAPELASSTLRANGLESIASRVSGGSEGSFIGYRQQKLKDILNEVNKKSVSCSNVRLKDRVYRSKV